MPRAPAPTVNVAVPKRTMLGPKALTPEPAVAVGDKFAPALSIRAGAVMEVSVAVVAMFLSKKILPLFMVMLTRPVALMPLKPSTVPTYMPVP